METDQLTLEAWWTTPLEVDEHIPEKKRRKRKKQRKKNIYIKRTNTSKIEKFEKL